MKFTVTSAAALLSKRVLVLFQKLNLILFNLQVRKNEQVRTGIEKLQQAES